MNLETAQQIKKYLLTGKNYYDAADEFGCTRETIKYWFKIFGIHISQEALYKKRSILADEIDQIIDMHRAGYTQSAITESLQINHITLNRALRARGIKIKKRWSLLTDSQFRKAERLLINGLNYPQTGERIGISHNTIRRYFDKYRGGAPAIDFKPTQADYDIMVDMLIDRYPKDKIAKDLKTTELFVTLMIMKLGASFYFSKKITNQTNHNFTESDVIFFVEQKFQGISTGSLVKILKTSRPTMDLLISKCEAAYLETL